MPSDALSQANSSDTNSPDFEDGSKNKQKAISDASQALKIAQRLEVEDMRRSYDRARVLAAFNGNAPYEDSALAAAGQAYRFNISFGFMEGMIGRAIVPYEDLVSDSDYIANMEGDMTEDKLSIMREEFAEALARWGGWRKFTSRLIQDLVLYGYNTAVFPSDYDPWPIFVPQRDSFVHEMTQNEVRDLELFVWRKTYLIHELYNKISDEEAAKAAGWNIDNVRKALQNAVPDDIYERGVRGAWEKLEMAIRAGTLYTTMVGGKQINTYHVFASEMDGSVTHYIVNAGKDWNESPRAENCELFKRESRWESFDELLVYFDLEPGDGKWHGSRGLGRRAFNTHKAVDKLRCAILDQAFVSGLTLLQPGDAASNEDFQLSVTGPFAVIPPGITIGQTTLPAISETSFQADSLLMATAEQRVGDVVPSTLNPVTGSDKTATQSTIDENRKQLISKSNLQRFLEPLSRLVSIMVRRLLKEGSPDPDAQIFQQALQDRGITPEEFKRIRGARSTGKIDTILGHDKTKMDGLLAAYRGDPDIDQKELKRRQIAATLGPKDVEGLLIPGPDKTKEIEAAREQREEIATMITGIPVDVSPRDFHEVHAAVGMDWLQGQVQNQSQGQPGASLSTIDMVAQHVKQHIAFLAGDKTKKDLVHKLDQAMRQIGHAVDNIESAAVAKARQMMPEQPPAAQPAPPAPSPTEPPQEPQPTSI